jgi:hypothetical protein
MKGVAQDRPSPLFDRRQHLVRDGVAIFVAAGRQPEPVKITGSGIATSPGR